MFPICSCLVCVLNLQPIHQFVYGNVFRVEVLVTDKNQSRLGLQQRRVFFKQARDLILREVLRRSKNRSGAVLAWGIHHQWGVKRGGSAE